MFTFLLAELPRLALDAPPPLTREELNEQMRMALIAPRFLAQLAKYDGTVSDAPAGEKLPRVYREYRDFEVFLRQTIARKRAKDQGREVTFDSTPEYRHDVVLAVDAAAAIADPLERERTIDRLRWQSIEEIAFGHELDFDALCAYIVKLELLIRRRHRDREVGLASFNSTLDGKVSHE